MVPVVLNRKEKLKILLKRIGEYLVDDIRKIKIWQDWMTGGKYFYFLMETEHVDRYTTQSIFFYPKSPDKWFLKIIRRTAVGYKEKYKTILDFDYLGHEDECVREFCKLPVWWKMIDAIDNMCQTRLDQNPKYRTLQHEMAERGELEKSKEFLDKYYNDPVKKAKHEAWKRRNEERMMREKELGIVHEPKKGRKRRRWLREREQQRQAMVSSDFTVDSDPDIE